MAAKRRMIRQEPETSSRKEKSVQFRVDDDQLEALDRAARKEGDTLGNWCRRNLLKLAGWEYREGA